MRSAAFFEDDARYDGLDACCEEASHVPLPKCACAPSHTPASIASSSLHLAGGRVGVVAGGPALGPFYLTFMSQPMAPGREGARLIRRQRVL